MLAVQQERRATIRPDVAVELSGAPSSARHDDPMNQKPAERVRLVDDHRIHEEFPQIGSHGAWRGSARGPQVRENDPDRLHAATRYSVSIRAATSWARSRIRARPMPPR